MRKFEECRFPGILSADLERFTDCVSICIYAEDTSFLSSVRLLDSLGRARDHEVPHEREHFCIFYSTSVYVRINTTLLQYMRVPCPWDWGKWRFETLTHYSFINSYRGYNSTGLARQGEPFELSQSGLAVKSMGSDGFKEENYPIFLPHILSRCRGLLRGKGTRENHWQLLNGKTST